MPNTDTVAIGSNVVRWTDLSKSHLYDFGVDIEVKRTRNDFGVDIVEPGIGVGDSDSDNGSQSDSDDIVDLER